MSLYCLMCRTFVPTTSNICTQCGASGDLRCSQCNARVPIGMFTCPACDSRAVVPSNPSVVSTELVPDLPAIGSAVVVSPRVPTVVERYEAGKYGVKAEVSFSVMRSLALIVSARA